MTAYAGHINPLLDSCLISGAERKVSFGPKICKRNDEHGRREQRLVFNPGICAKEVDGESEPLLGFLPAGLQIWDGNRANGLKSTLACGEDNKCAHEDSEVQGKPARFAFFLESLKQLQRILPPRRDLRQRKIRTPKLDTQRVHPHEDLSDLLIRKRLIKNVHYIRVVSYLAYSLQAF